MNKIFKNALMASVMLLGAGFMTGCSTDDFATQTKPVDGIQISFKTSDYSEVNLTRAVNASAIKDVTILEFVNGTATTVKTLENLDFTVSNTVEGLTSVPATTLNEDGSIDENGKVNIVYFLANMKAAGLASQFTTGLTYDAFKKLTYKFNDLAALSNLEYIPMYGSYTNGITDGVTNQINATLTRAMAYVKFTVDVSNFTQADSKLATEGAVTSVSASNIKLHNIPLVMSMPYAQASYPALPVNSLNGVWSKGFDSSKIFPAYEASNFVESTDAAELAQTTDASATVLQFYMPANCRGSYDGITSYENKKSKMFSAYNTLNTAYQGATYITFDVKYSTAKGAVKTASYTVPLGGNVTGDLNLRANTQYTVTTYVYGANQSSTTISVSEDFNVTDVTATDATATTILDNANCYMLDGTKISSNKYNGKTLVLPLLQVRNGWQYVQDNDGKGNDYITDLDALIEAGYYTIETLWSTYKPEEGTSNNVTGSTASDLLTKAQGEAKFKNYFAQISLPATPNGNNTLIVLKASQNQGTTIKAGDILWSWHLWFTDYDVSSVYGKSLSAPDPGNETSVTNGTIQRYNGDAFKAGGYYATSYGMMDRNLGARITGFTATKYVTDNTISTDASVHYGCYYQFGRKDPFPYGQVYKNDGTAYTINSNVCFTVNKSLTSTSHDDSDLKYCINNPMVWQSNQTVWNQQQTTNEDWPTQFDPSPAGWELPYGDSNTMTKNVWGDFGDSSNNYITGVSAWNGTLKGATYVVNSTVNAFYPASGFVLNSSGAFSHAGSVGGSYGRTTTSSTIGRNLYFHSNGMNRSDYSSRACAFPVRPVQKN